jgi:hypothetical protein
MKRTIYQALFCAVQIVLIASVAQAQQQPKKDNMNRMAGMSDEEMNRRGDHVMGFDHNKTRHHFRLSPEGGTIEVTANSLEDKESRDQIRSHLSHISKKFAAGDFNAPMLIHDQIPPGVPVMQKLKNEIEYRFEETERGATSHFNQESDGSLGDLQVSKISD